MSYKHDDYYVNKTFCKENRKLKRKKIFPGSDPHPDRGNNLFQVTPDRNLSGKVVNRLQTNKILQKQFRNKPYVYTS